MLKSVLVVGLLAGLAAGLATAALQHFTTVPLIIAAEAYEKAPAVASHDLGPDAAADGHAGAAGAAGVEHRHDAGAWAPADGIERTMSTLVATVVSAIGFALVLIAVMLLAGETITPLTALAYAAAGFAATGLATGLGLAPELPGSAAGDLVARQAWWIGTALATAAGLYALIRIRTPLAVAAGVLLVLGPHLVGAPEPGGYASTAPAELAARFASTSLVVHAAFWALVGIAVGTTWQRLARAPAI